MLEPALLNRVWILPLRKPSARTAPSETIAMISAYSTSP
jgi:hypothetical protein